MFLSLCLQVEFAVLRNNAELRSIYSFYSRLGSTGSPNNIFLLSRLQLWRLLKDCYIHHDITLTEIDRLISGENDGRVAVVEMRFSQVL